jgi:hypothetical protein
MGGLFWASPRMIRASKFLVCMRASMSGFINRNTP